MKIEVNEHENLNYSETDRTMCSSGIETQNLKYRTNDDNRTNVKERTEPAIAYSRC